MIEPYNKSTLKKMVVDAYHTDANIVNDDALLLAYIWGRLGWNNDAPLEANLRRMPRPESVTRRRREAFNEGLIKYSKQASDERMNAFQNERDGHSAFYVGLEQK